MIFILGFIIAILAIFVNALIYLFAVLMILIIVLLRMIPSEYLPYILIGILITLFIRRICKE
ncbi:hypothetical protein [Campylobacter lanienae]|uniref:hypothetical protein n=1 Tax=Campylobacter lanienae TaxID=75658 RepID=UPI002A91A236|nr:hypothetical protein [Campylobacter lanienae]MDY5518948.1 hypothetical protein [Campylobacter lanienae]